MRKKNSRVTGQVSSRLQSEYGTEVRPGSERWGSHAH